MSSKEVLCIKVDVTNLVIPELVEGNDILEVLNETSYPVIMGELIEHVRKIE